MLHIYFQIRSSSFHFCSCRNNLLVVILSNTGFRSRNQNVSRILGHHPTRPESRVGLRADVEPVCDRRRWLEVSLVLQQNKHWVNLLKLLTIWCSRCAL